MGGEADDGGEAKDECFCNVLIVGKELGGVMSKAKEVINQAYGNDGLPFQQNVWSISFSQILSIHLECFRFPETWLPPSLQHLPRLPCGDTSHTATFRPCALWRKERVAVDKQSGEERWEVNVKEYLEGSGYLADRVFINWD